jgi:hypothetical protein
MSPDHKCVINIIETADGLLGHPAKFLFEKLAIIGDSSKPMATYVCSQQGSLQDRLLVSLC